jgi:hypothetical protein
VNIGFIVAYGERSRSFFADSLLAHLCQRARDLGHEAKLVHVYFDGRDTARDAIIRERLASWVREHACEMVVTDRVFDPASLRGSFRSVLISRGDSFDAIDEIEVVVGAVPGPTRSGRTRRTATVPELALAFERLLASDDPASVPGVGVVRNGAIIAGPPLEPPSDERGFAAVVESDVISLDEPPRQTHTTIFGNAGCPYSRDPMEEEHFRGLVLPEHAARLGCAFCAMGGDYEKRSDAAVVATLIDQARFWTARNADIEALVLDDQAPLRYLPALIRGAHQQGVRPLRWLFAARPDAFVRDRARVEEAIAAARDTDQRLELYLSGFESFSDAELRRYNKGLQATDLANAIAVMRELAARHPDHFLYDRARGHSLILWSPWTTPEDLSDTTRALRTHGGRELFHELGKNRLRLYDDLPIRAAAARDGALVAAWEDGDEGEGRRKGYNVEQPWRFLDRRTRVARALAEILRARLGAETELAQLTAIARFTAAAPLGDDTIASVTEALSSLEAAFESLVAGGHSTKASAVLLTGPCNNGCAACANNDRFLDDRIEARIQQARTIHRPIMLAGREPTVHPRFAALVALARGEDQRRVGVVTNGRLFSIPVFASRARRAGLTGASVKLFAPDAERADAISRAPGSHEQALLGLRALQGADLEIRAPLHASIVDDFAAMARVGGAATIRVECALDALGLDRLAAGARAIGALIEAARREGIRVEGKPLAAGTTCFDIYPSSA